NGATLPVEVIRKQISSAIDIMIHLMRLRDNSRKIVAISEVLGVENGEVVLNPLYEFVEEGEKENGEVIGKLVSTGNNLVNQSKANL
ncbi:CpaF family protein, partial [Staphylococcus sp. SIMBA_130]